MSRRQQRGPSTQNEEVMLNPCNDQMKQKLIKRNVDRSRFNSSLKTVLVCWCNIENQVFLPGSGGRLHSSNMQRGINTNPYVSQSVKLHPVQWDITKFEYKLLPPGPFKVGPVAPIRNKKCLDWSHKEKTSNGNSPLSLRGKSYLLRQLLSVEKSAADLLNISAKKAKITVITCMVWSRRF